MKSRKKDIIQFLVWTRNGTAFCVTWFLILWLLLSYRMNKQTILVSNLAKMICLCFGGVFLFNILFTRILIKKWSFVKRVTVFMIGISIYEGVAFYWTGFFAGKGSWGQWLCFSGIVCALYFISIIIYKQYSKRKGILYTQALRNYQLQRRNENG